MVWIRQRWLIIELSRFFFRSSSQSNFPLYLYAYVCIFISMYIIVFYYLCADSCKWMSKETALNFLLKVTKNCERVGPFVVIGLMHNLTDSENWKTSLTSPYQVSFSGVSSLILYCILLSYVSITF